MHWSIRHDNIKRNETKVEYQVELKHIIYSHYLRRGSENVLQLGCKLGKWHVYVKMFGINRNTIISKTELHNKIVLSFKSNFYSSSFFNVILTHLESLLPVNDERVLI